jgi:antitoxin (DNA-binding transcriptional repressor) of toxin-antitoxin stability system
MEFRLKLIRISAGPAFNRHRNFFYIFDMETVSVGKLKTSFAEVLKVVKNGRHVGVLYGKSKKPVIMIIPFTESEDGVSSYEVGKKYFGKYGSGNGCLSQDYKKRLKQKLYDKYHSR